MHLTSWITSLLIFLSLSFDVRAASLLDKIVSQGVPLHVANVALAKSQQFSSYVKRQDHLAIIDFTVHSGRPRFYLVDTLSGKVDKLLVAHGEGSDPQGTGTPSRFSNIPDSHMSSLGSYIVAEIYQSKKFGTAARLDGLESSNNLARQRAIVLHGAKYVSETRSVMGMSWGCPAISLQWIQQALSRLAGGAFLYAYGPPSTATGLDESLLQRLMIDPTHLWTDESEGAPVDGVW